jgi:uncharacterized protein (TIGR02118 family)
MIKVSVFYPYTPGAKFDMGYYLQTHIPLVQKRLGTALKGVNVEQGVSGAGLGEPMTYIAIAHLGFESAETFRSAFGAHAAEIQGDIPNYTAITPIFQISDVKL